MKLFEMQQLSVENKQSQKQVTGNFSPCECEPHEAAKLQEQVKNLTIEIRQQAVHKQTSKAKLQDKNQSERKLPAVPWLNSL